MGDVEPGVPMDFPLTRTQIVERIRARVVSGEWPRDDDGRRRLPPAQELADEYEVSLTTMRWVLDRLQVQGVLVSRQGVGWFVAE